MKKKVAEIQAKENVLNSAAYKKAAAIFQQTGSYPNVPVPEGNSVGVQALRWALTRRGDPYVWGAAGPTTFDCSGLVMWAYAQVGISLAHLTFDQWNEGEHVPSDQAQPGDLVFLYGLNHVGMYIGNGLFVDAPHLRRGRGDRRGPLGLGPTAWCGSSADRAAGQQANGRPGHHVPGRPFRVRTPTTPAAPAGTGSSPG